jgi:hypothetical protein
MSIGQKHSVTKPNRWRVVLAASEPPRCGEWLAVNGMELGNEETVRFTYLDGSHADGFTFRNETAENGLIFSTNGIGKGHRADDVPWLYFPDCMEIVGVENLEWRPAGWPYDNPLWLLTMKSLPSNVEFEKRLLAK